MSGIEGVGQILVTVEDLEGSIVFYRDALGIPFLFQVPGQGFAFLDCGGVRLFLSREERPDFRSDPVLYLTVSDIDATYQHLRDRDVPFIDEPHIVHRDDSTELWMTFFRDPDGRPLALMEERPASG